MKIRARAVAPEGTRFTGEEPPEILDLEGEELVRLNQPVAYDLTAQVVSGELVVQGAVSTRAEVLCSRCAEFFSTSLSDSSFLRAYDIPEGGEEVDVTGDLREAILLQMPDYPICSAACKGLCPRCGRNLNEGPCGCAPPAEDARWDALEGL